MISFHAFVVKQMFRCPSRMLLARRQLTTRQFTGSQDMRSYLADIITINSTMDSFLLPAGLPENDSTGQWKGRGRVLPLYFNLHWSWNKWAFWRASILASMNIFKLFSEVQSRKRKIGTPLKHGSHFQSITKFQNLKVVSLQTYITFARRQRYLQVPIAFILFFHFKSKLLLILSIGQFIQKGEQFQEGNLDKANFLFDEPLIIVESNVPQYLWSEYETYAYLQVLVGGIRYTLFTLDNI